MTFKEFVKYPLALRLKELGFDAPRFGYYAGDILCTGRPQEIHLDKDGNYKKTKTESYPIITAPTFSQAFRWFREKYGLHSFIDCKWKNLGWEYELVDLNKMESISTIGNYGYNAPEDAELACLIKLIEIVENEKTL